MTRKECSVMDEMLQFVAHQLDARLLELLDNPFGPRLSLR